MSQLLIRVTPRMNLKNITLVKEARYKRLLMIELCLYEISRKGRYGCVKHGCLGVGAVIEHIGIRDKGNFGGGAMQVFYNWILVLVAQLFKFKAFY